MNSLPAELLGRLKDISLLKSASSLLYWDTETYMPTGSSGLRSEQIATLATLIHEKESDPRLMDAALKLPASDPQAKRLKKTLLKNQALDKDLVAALARAQINSHEAWKHARQQKRYDLAEAGLRELVKLNREWAQRMKEYAPLREFYGARTFYEIQMDSFEPGFEATEVTRLFTQLEQGLVPLIGQVIDRQKQRGQKPDAHAFAAPLAQQREWCERVTRDLGFDFTRGRVDVSVHPFSGGSPEDVRMTTRYDESDLSVALGGIVHETGHSLYEQSLPKEFLHTPCGEAASMGVHESQSRFYENHIGRSMAFCRYFERISGRNAERYWQHINNVEKTYIRVDADELTYNMHILLRWKLEEALIEGTLDAHDLPGAWNERFEKLFGIKVPSDNEGCLQDTHWYGGAYGYFPSYTLGNLLAAALFRDWKLAEPQWEKQIEDGHFSPVLRFLNERVHRHAAFDESPGTIKKALLDKSLSVEPFLSEMREKYLGV